MPPESQFEQELEAQEKKHRRWMKYDLETIVVILVIAAFVVVVNLGLRSEYRSIGKVKSGIAVSMTECNKSILDVAETYRKNTFDSLARARVDGAKMSFDTAITDYNRFVNKRENDGLLVRELDSCYLAAATFRTMLGSKKALSSSLVTPEMLDVMDNQIRHLGVMIDSLAVGVEAYNSSGFFLTFSWLTPYPGKLEYQHSPLPELQPYPDI